MRPRFALLAVLLVPLLSACGGGDDEGDAQTTATAGPTPSAAALTTAPSAARVAYTAAADGVCARAVAAAKLIAQPGTAPQVVDAVKRTLAVGKEGLRGLKAITPPAEDAAALKAAFLDPIAQQVAAFETVIPVYEAAAASADPTEAFSKIADPGVSVTVDLEYIERYGMPSCATFAGKR